MEEALENITPKKSSGLDFAMSWKLKNVAKGVATSPTNPLHNHCTDKSEWPTSWKMGARTPVFMKGDRRDAKYLSPYDFHYSI